MVGVGGGGRVGRRVGKGEEGGLGWLVGGGVVSIREELFKDLSHLKEVRRIEMSTSTLSEGGADTVSYQAIETAYIGHFSKFLIKPEKRLEY